MPDLIFDTETTGIVPKGTTALTAMPYIIQLAGKLVDGETVLAQFSSFVVPEKTDGTVARIPKEKFFLDQGYTDEFVAGVGMKALTAGKIFHQLMRRADRMIAHNAKFDIPVLSAFFKRLGHEPVSPPVFCTMLTAEPILKLPGKYGYKWPRLDETYKHFVSPNGFEGAHDAMIDVTACHQIAIAMERKSINLVEVKDALTF